MDIYKAVINQLKAKLPDKEINWSKILRATQELKESVHAYYKRLMQIFIKYSGVKGPEKEGISGFVKIFVHRLHPELSLHVPQNMMCWQAKGIDEILKYAKYSSDWLETKQEKVKD